MLDNLSDRLGKVIKTIKGQARLSEDNIQEGCVKCVLHF